MSIKGKDTPLGKIDLTGNFQIIRFKDHYGSPCSLQQSSLADFGPTGSNAVLLGRDESGNRTMRMHLSREQVKALIPVLEMWVQTGNFAEEPPPDSGDLANGDQERDLGGHGR